MFDCHPTKVRETVEEHGVAVVHNVLDDAQCSSMINGMWSFFEQITRDSDLQLDRALPTTWSTFYKLAPLHSMLVQHHGVGHANFAWDLRQNPKILDIFASIWGVPPRDLIVSFDGCSMHLPPETTGTGWANKPPPFHTDQSFTVNGLRTIQSLVTARDMREDDATFAFLTDSHTLHHEFGDTLRAKRPENWHKLLPSQLRWYSERGCKEKRLCAPAGSMVFWDSRLIHCGVEPLPSRAAPETRFVSYLCYLPRACSSEANLLARIKAFEERRTSSHLPSENRLFSRKHRQDTVIRPPLDQPVIEEIGRRLIGFE